MKHDNILASDKNQVQNPINEKPKSSRFTLLAWWYGLVTPPDPPANANFDQREKVRHARLASLTVPLYMLFLLNMLPPTILPVMGLLVGETLCIVALFFNRKGWIIAAGVLLLTMEYVGLTATVLTSPGGLTLSSLYHLDFTILPDILLLTFFSADMLLLVVCVSALQTWLLVTYGPHDQVIAHILQTEPSQIFSHIYTLQIITAIVLYLWARSTEKAIRRADRAEEIAAFEKREKELREQELAQKYQLNVGIQQILQTHVAVANGDFAARAPLSQDHMLWQVAVALNNLIARIQRLSHAEQKYKQRVWKESNLTTNEHMAFEKNKATTQKTNIVSPRTHLER